MLTLALDLSTKSSGWALFENQDLIKYGCITAGSANLFNRIDKMTKELSDILDSYNIDNVVIEDVIPEDVHNNQQIYKVLTYLQGFILRELDHHSITNIKFYVSSEWRKLCGIKTGKGVKRESLKPQDIAFVQNQFDIKVNDDVADAICIGFAAVGGTIKKPQIMIKDDFEFG